MPAGLALLPITLGDLPGIFGPRAEVFTDRAGRYFEYPLGTLALENDGLGR